MRLLLCSLFFASCLQAQEAILVNSILRQQEEVNVSSGTLKKFRSASEFTEKVIRPHMATVSIQRYSLVQENGITLPYTETTIIAYRLRGTNYYDAVSGETTVVADWNPGHVLHSHEFSFQRLQLLSRSPSTPACGKRVFVDGTGERRYKMSADHYWRITVPEHLPEVVGRVKSIVYPVNGTKLISLNWTVTFTSGSYTWRPPKPSNAWQLPASFGGVSYWTVSEPEFW